MKIRFEGKGTDEVGIIDAIDADRLAAACAGAVAPPLDPAPEPLAPGRVVVRVDPRYFRPTEVVSLLGDSTKARQVLGWKPAVSFAELAKEMVQADLAVAQAEVS
jgi:GDPmannose 4,6-dehydratase